MKTKKTNQKIHPAIDGHFSIKLADTGKDLEIEGFANKAVVDRGNDLIDPKAWELDNYLKNPVLLFNHDSSKPIGKVTEIKPTEQGLLVKAKLSKSQAPEIQMIRDLVKEKILRAFSVGFEPKDERRDEKGVNRITKAELFEISVVGIPMNQDSIFDVKSFKSKSYQDVKTDLLRRKGAWVAGAVHNKIYELQKEGNFDREAALAKVAEAAGIDAAALTDILAGNVTPVPEAVLTALSENLSLSLDELKKLDAGDSAVENQEGDDEETESGEGDDSASQEDGEADEEGGAGEGSQDDDEDEGGEGQEDEDPKAKDYQDCVAEKIPQLIAEGKDQEEAVAIAISMCSEKGCNPSRQQYQKFFDIADAEKLKQAGQEGVDGVTQPLPQGKEAVDNGQPSLELAKQTNVLLGALIAEIQKLGAKLDQLAKPEPAPSQTPPPQAEEGKSGDRQAENTAEGHKPEPGKSKAALDYAEKCIENLEQRLKSLGY